MTGWESLTAREPRNRVLPCRPTICLSAFRTATSISLLFRPAPYAPSHINTAQSSGTAAQNAQHFITRGHESIRGAEMLQS